MNLKSLIRSKKTVLGTWLTIPSPTIVEIIAQSGFDWLAIDLEHSCIDLHQCLDLIRIADLAGVAPMVRASGNDPIQIKRVLDAGAHGMIMPMIVSAEDVEKAYKSIHYPPKGNRGVGLSRAQKYGPGFSNYFHQSSENLALIIQIEHKDALPNLDSMFATGYADGFMVGLYDLSASLGVPGDFQHELVLGALDQIYFCAEKHSIAKGVHIVEMDKSQLSDFTERGYSFIAYGVDFRVLESNYSLAKGDFQRLSDR